MLSRTKYDRNRAFGKYLKQLLFISAGVISAAFGLEAFIIPNQFLDGGAMGIALIVQHVTKWPLPPLILLINTPFVLIAWKQVSAGFALRTLAAFTGLALAVAFIPFEPITSDKILISVFGGMFLGLGIGLSIRGSAVLDGTEVAALWFSRKYYAKIGDVILIINILIFVIGGIVVNIETAMYAILTYGAASKTIDFVVQGIEEYIGVTIVSNHCQALRLAIIQNMGRGVTIYNGQGGYGRHGIRKPEDTQIIYTVVTRLEISKLMQEIDAIDPRAFIVQSSIIDIKGGMVRRRSHAH